MGTNEAARLLQFEQAKQETLAMKTPTAYHIAGLTAAVLLVIFVVGMLVDAFNSYRRRKRKRK
jgi:hypothetical protein